MSMVGTFDGFTAARLGIYAAQHGLRVTGNNVSNINTPGYTRQRVDQVSFKVGANDMYRSQYDNHVGSGALVNGINQIRDPYLDIRYRNASTDTYHYDTWLSGMQHIASILDEVGKGDNEDGLIYRAIQDLSEKLRSYSANPTPLNDRLVRNSASSLTLMFHNAATQLEKLYSETVNEFNEDVTAVNEILTNIRDLNRSIRETEIHGDHALEMRDERNRQIDALSQYLDIKVEYSFEDVGGGVQVEKLTIKLNDANPDNSVHTDESVLVDGLYATQLSVPDVIPRLNGYDGTDPAQSDYLKGYKYLKEVTMTEEELNEFIAAHNGNYPIWERSDENGDPLYLMGTNDPDVDGIVTEENTNFTIQLGKLLNEKGAEWKNTTTAWLDVTAAEAAANGKFAFTIGTTLDAGKRFSITYIENGEEKTRTYTVGTDVDASIASDAEQFAQFLAAEFNKLNKFPGYKVEANGDQVVFTADPKSNDYPPATPPVLTVTAEGESAGLITVGVRRSIPAEEYDEHGNVTKSVDYVQIKGKWYQLTISTEYTHKVTLDDNDLHGILQAQRELLTEEGEFSSEKDVAIDESALTKRGIPYYMKSLDLLAQKFADAYNQLNTGYAFNEKGNYIKENGEEVLLDDIFELDKNGKATPMPVNTDGLTDGQMQNLINNNDKLHYILTDKNGYFIDENGDRIKDKDGNFLNKDNITPDDFDKLVVDMDQILDKLEAYPMGGSLFTNLDGESTEGITAKNISISHGWSNGLWNLVPTFKMLFTDSGGLTHSTKNDNADHMVAMIDKDLTYNPRDLYGSDAIGPELFNGSFNDMLSNMMAVQGEDADMTNVRLTTAAGILNEVDYSREGVSGVDLNDEAMNMITYQKAMSAAMRVMTAIDEMLDRLINNTGIT